MASKEDDCPCKKGRTICCYCNGTGKVPEGLQGTRGWWMTTPMPGDVWAETNFEKCENCRGTGPREKPMTKFRIRVRYRSLVEDVTKTRTFIYPLEDLINGAFGRIAGTHIQILSIDQSIERKDEDGDDIFENDIVSGANGVIWSDNDPVVFVVKRETHEDSDYPQVIEGIRLPSPLRGELKVLGNTHENPELLREKQHAKEK